MATHSSVLAWRIPGTGEPGELPSMGLHRVGHDWRDLAAKTVYWVKSDKYHILQLICGILKIGTNELIYKSEIESQM